MSSACCHIHYTWMWPICASNMELTWSLLAMSLLTWQNSMKGKMTLPTVFASFALFIIIIIYPLTASVVWAPQMILQTVFSIFPCSPLPSGTLQSPGLSIPWCCLPTSSSVCLVIVPLSLSLARWVWPDLMNGRHDHTTAVCVSLRWSGGPRLVQLPAGPWHGLPRCNMVFVGSV